jgi:hypothetical protein
VRLGSDAVELGGIWTADAARGHGVASVRFLGAGLNDDVEVLAPESCPVWCAFQRSSVERLCLSR